jgi:small-conductance mechanosensitive channel
MIPHFVQQIKNVTPFSPWIIGPAIALLWIAVLLRLKRWILGAIRGYLAGRTSWVWADSLIESLSPAISIVIVAVGVALLQGILPLGAHADRAVGMLLAGLSILALIVFTDRICRRFLTRLALRSPALQGELGLFEGIVRGIIIALGVLVFLNTIGVSITPIIASLGIGTVAVALALQDTLANLFAGIYMIAERPIEGGHFIKLESGEQGYVTKVGWRSTQIRMLGDTVVVVPNSKLAGSVITNMSLPKEELAVTLDVGVDYGCDLDRVEAVTLEVARGVMASVAGAIPGFEPRMRFHTFADSSINFTVWLRAKDYVSGMALKHEFIKQLHSRYGREGIGIPFPIRTIDLPENTIAKLRGIFSGRADASSNGIGIAPHDEES